MPGSYLGTMEQLCALALTVPVNNNTTGYGAKQMNSTSTRTVEPLCGSACAGQSLQLAADEMSDAELIKQIAVADERAMQVFYERHYQSVYRLVCRTLHSTQSAEDIASDVFLEVWCKAGSFEGRSEVATWLFAIARNKSISVRRQRTSDPWDEAAMELIEDDADGPELKLHKQSTDSTVRKCLDQLVPGASCRDRPGLLPRQFDRRRRQDSRHRAQYGQDTAVLCPQATVGIARRARHRDGFGLTIRAEQGSLHSTPAEHRHSDRAG